MDTLSIKEEEQIVRGKVAIPLLWISIVAMFMIFASLTSAYVVSRGKGGWLQFELPQFFYFSTAIILISSITMNWTLSSAKKNNFKNIKIGAILTFLLGFAFIICQFKAWGDLVDQKVFFAGKSSNGSGSYLYALTGVHLAHFIFGIASLAVVSWNSIRNKYNAENLMGIRLCSIFWHFLDVLWVYLFLFLLFVR